jgi:uncharacterized membrane protein
MFGDAPRPAERTIVFTDAVVAIAMTLLILPLLDAVAESARNSQDTLAFLRAHGGQLITFGLSFVIIALFWRSHDRTFSRLARTTTLIFWLNTAWMFTIVFLPVVTAIVGALHTDPVQLALYIGTMLATSLIMTAIHLVLVLRPELTTSDEHRSISELAPALASSLMFAVALVLALTVPGVEFWGLLALTLSRPIEAVLRRLLERR